MQQVGIEVALDLPGRRFRNRLEERKMLSSFNLVGSASRSMRLSNDGSQNLIELASGACG